MRTLRHIAPPPAPTIDDDASPNVERVSRARKPHRPEQTVVGRATIRGSLTVTVEASGSATAAAAASKKQRKRRRTTAVGNESRVDLHVEIADA